MVRTARAKPVKRATARQTLSPVSRAGNIILASSPSVALRSPLGYMLSPTSWAVVGRLFFQEHKAVLQSIALRSRLRVFQFLFKHLQMLLHRSGVWVIVSQEFSKDLQRSLVEGHRAA